MTTGLLATNNIMAVTDDAGGDVDFARVALAVGMADHAPELLDYFTARNYLRQFDGLLQKFIGVDDAMMIEYATWLRARGGLL